MITINMNCTLNREYMPQQGGLVYLAIEIEPHPTESSNRLPLNVCLLIDSSGSMEGEKIIKAKEATASLIDGLESKDYASVVTFESKVNVIVEGSSVFNKNKIKEKINAIEAGGTTELYRGLEKAYEELKRSQTIHELRPHEPSKEPVKRVILLSDGRPTDEVQMSQYIKLAQEMRNFGISITVLGIGDDYNEELLSAISENSSGSWYHLTSPEEIPTIFLKELSYMETVLCASPELVFHQGTRVEVGSIQMIKPEIYEIPVKKREGRIHCPLRDIRHGEMQSLVAKLHIPYRTEMKDKDVVEMHIKIAEVELIEPKDATRSSFQTILKKNVIAKYTQDENMSVETDAYPRDAFLTAETTVLAKKAISSADKTIIKEAEKKAETILKIPATTKIVAEQRTKVREALDKIKKGLSNDEKKKMSRELTLVRR